MFGGAKAPLPIGSFIGCVASASPLYSLDFIPLGGAKAPLPIGSIIGCVASASPY